LNSANFIIQFYVRVAVGNLWLMLAPPQSTINEVKTTICKLAAELLLHDDAAESINDDKVAECVLLVPDALESDGMLNVQPYSARENYVAIIHSRNYVNMGRVIHASGRKILRQLHLK
jgi:hypothetical protein